MTIGLMLVAVLGVTQCGFLASAPDNLARATAIFIGDNTDPDAVKISDIKRGMTSVKWTATTSKAVYACSADDMVRKPYCVKKTSTPEAASESPSRPI